MDRQNLDGNMSAGRPTDYTPEIGSAICAEIALGYSLRTICTTGSMPCVATIFNWLRVHPEFLEQYTRAKEEQADALAEEMLDIADDGTNDWVEKNGKDGKPFIALDAEHVQRSRLRIETRKWIASKLKPKKYGEKVNVEATGKDGTPLNPPTVHIFLPDNGRTTKQD
jgi:hypothetical protein